MSCQALPLGKASLSGHLASFNTPNILNDNSKQMLFDLYKVYTGHNLKCRGINTERDRGRFSPACSSAAQLSIARVKDNNLMAQCNHSWRLKIRTATSASSP